LGEDEVNNNEVTLKRVMTKQQVTVSVYEMVNVIENWLNESREEEEGNNGTASNDGMLN